GPQRGARPAIPPDRRAARRGAGCQCRGDDRHERVRPRAVLPRPELQTREEWAAQVATDPRGGVGPEPGAGRRAGSRAGTLRDPGDRGAGRGDRGRLARGGQRGARTGAGTCRPAAPGPAPAGDPRLPPGRGGGGGPPAVTVQGRGRHVRTRGRPRCGGADPGRAERGGPRRGGEAVRCPPADRVRDRTRPADDPRRRGCRMTPKFVPAAELFAGWREDVRSGTPPTLYPGGEGALPPLQLRPRPVTL